MKKLIFLITGLALLSSLMGCASATSTSAPKPTLAPTPNANEIIPMTGIVVVKPEVTKAELRTGPGEEYPLVTTMLPGQTAELIGLNTKGDWCLINVKGVTGWGPLTEFAARIAN